MKNKVKQRMLSSLATVGIISLVLTGCEAFEGQETHEFTPAPSAISSEVAETPSSSIPQKQEQVQQEVMALAVGRLDPASEVLTDQIGANQETLKSFQVKTANSLGAAATKYRTILGHTIYMEDGTNNGYIFSGPEMLEFLVSIDPTKLDSPVYNESKLYQAVARYPGALRTEEGVLMAADDGGWEELPEDTEKYGAVWVDGDYFDDQSGSTMGNGEKMRLGALTGGSLTIETAKEKFEKAEEHYQINGKRFGVIGGRAALRLLFDGQNTFSFMVNKMCFPVNVNSFVVDTEKTLAMLNEEFGTEAVKFQWLELPIGETIELWDAGMSETVTMDGITTGADGELEIAVDQLRDGVGLRVMFNPTTKRVNLITNGELLQSVGADGAGAERGIYETFVSVKAGEDGYTVMVNELKGREQELEIQRQMAEKQNAEIAAAAKAEAEAAAMAKEKAAVEASKAVSGSGTGSTSSSSGTAGSGSDVSGSPGTSEEDWPVLGGWVFKPGDPNSPDPYEQPGSQSNLSGSFVGMDEPTYSTLGGDLVKRNLRASEGRTAVWSKKYGGWIETMSDGSQVVTLPDGDGFRLKY